MVVPADGDAEVKAPTIQISTGNAPVAADTTAAPRVGSGIIDNPGGNHAPAEQARDCCSWRWRSQRPRGLPARPAQAHLTNHRERLQVSSDQGHGRAGERGDYRAITGLCKTE